MMSRWSLVLLAGCVLVANVSAQSALKPRLDALGDPLPDGAVARLGTQRLKHSTDVGKDVHKAVFSPNGKMFASLDASASNIHLWDTASGKEIPGPWSSASLGCSAAAFSPDGDMLATATQLVVVQKSFQYQVMLYKIAPAIQIKVDNGLRFPNLRSPRELVRQRNNVALVFADAGTTLVLAGAGTVSWWDVATGKQKRLLKLFGDEKQPAEGGGTKTKLFDICDISPDARSIAVHVAWAYDQPGAQQFRADAVEHEAIGFDLATGKMTWRAVGNYNYDHKSHFAYSADGKRIAIAMGPDRLEVRNAHTGKLIAMPLERKFTAAGWHALRYSEGRGLRLPRPSEYLRASHPILAI